MKIKKEKIAEVLETLDQVAEAVAQEEEQHAKVWHSVHEGHIRSARNLIHYTAFRKFDLCSTQKKLRNLGLTRFANAEGHVMASLNNTRFILNRLLDNPELPHTKSGLSIKKGKRLLAKNTKALLGYRSKGRRVRIMVTQPTEAAYNYQMVLEMVQAGMNCARINCAHDNPDIWKRIIDNVRKAAKGTGRNIKIAMDLAGPKIRTGGLAPGPKVRKFKPSRDVRGNTIKPAEIVLTPMLTDASPSNALSISTEDLARLKTKDVLSFTDTRGKSRKLKIVALNEHIGLAHCAKTSYIETGMTLEFFNRKGKPLVVGELPPVEQPIILYKGDILTVAKEAIKGQPAQMDEKGGLVQNARISCQLPEAFDYVKSGERILFDDGKIEGRVEAIRKGEWDVRITSARDEGSKLRSGKGINFPDTALKINGLTAKDKTDLEFVARHADIVNFSFVKRREDVEQLYAALDKLGVLHQLGVILKIETKYALEHLREILLAAMKSKPIGVMIARGDLAVETGWDSIGRVQQEILTLCGAAHIPVVWATQVLENLAKKGLPSRSEITDAVAAMQAECVMLNKGPYILSAIRLLHMILSDMEAYHDKKEVMLPKLHSAEADQEEAVASTV
ncbi:pyruvate kinase [Robiginitalea sp. IMCC44478]|uniref:pyruvate kinase n=1 Tax=Robiginitalea sp. IMCC44478 TaxID=3459122 RepID=UPI004042A09A